MALIDAAAPASRLRAVEILSGIDLVVRLPELQQASDRMAGLRTSCVVSGYPGSPLGGVDLALVRRGAANVEHVPAVNEELAAAVVWGSQQRNLMDLGPAEGVIGMWYGKSPGIDRSGDVLKHANSMGTACNGGVVVVVGDDPAAKSSSIPNDTRAAFFDAQMPVLVPADLGDLVQLGLHGFALSRFSGLWVGLKVVTDLADGLAALNLDELGVDPVLPGVLVDGMPWRHVQIPTVNNTVSVQQERDILTGRLEAARAYARANRLNRVTHDCDDAWLGIVAAGRAYGDVLRALEIVGLRAEDLAEAGIRVLKIGMPYPLEPTVVRSFASGLEEILVVEEKRPFLELFVRDVLYGAPEHPPVVGKHDRDGRAVVPVEGDLTVERLVPVLRARLEAKGLGIVQRAAPVGSDVTAPDLAGEPSARRMPAFCSGCPHNRSTAGPPGAILGGGVGCHSIIYLEDRHRDDLILPLTPMGAEGVPWIGASPFTQAGHIFQNLGDGTFAHSGTLAVRACVTAGVNITFKLLYNAAVAMTGAQPVAGGTGVPELTRELEALGVRQIIVCADDPGKYPSDARFAPGVRVWPRERLSEAERVLAGVSGVTALVYDQRCAAESRRLWKRGRLAEPLTRVVINEAVCEGCGDCQRKSNCLSVVPVATPLGRKTQVHQASCNHDLTCLEGDCPSFLSVTVPSAGTRKTTRPVPPAPMTPAPPSQAQRRETLSVYLVGIGGTGVVTANRILAAAASAEGWAVTGLDQTGLSQKAGAVVSHLKASRGREPLTNSVGEGECDLLLAFDPLAATEPRHLRRLDPERSLAVVSANVTPTLSMSRDPDHPLPSAAALRERIARSARATIAVDAEGLSQALFDDHLPANLITIGAAVQAGFLPLAPESIERAIGGLGSAAEVNVAAFRWGRAVGHDPSVAEPPLRAVAAPSVPAPGRAATARARRWLSRFDLPAAVSETAGWCAADLADYQDGALAERYLSVVARASAAERAVDPTSDAFAGSVAASLYKLMAYKDEYEVARLHLQRSFRSWVSREHPEAKVRFLLQPPALRALGLRRKIAVPAEVAVPAFRVLRAMRRVRGTRLDVFGRSEVRRLERELVEEYAALAIDLAGRLTQANLARCVEIARLPDVVRGYEQIKLTGIEEYRRRLAGALAAL